MTPRIRAATAISAMLVLMLQAAAQTSSASRMRKLLGESAVDRLVDQLIENATAFRATLPSITAHETIQSSGTYSWFFGSHAKAEATMRVMRKTPGGPLEESRLIRSVNGKPVAAGKHVDLPTMLIGGFGGLGGAFFTEGVRHCMDYSLISNDSEETLRLRIKLKPEAASLGNCPAGMERMSATALVDAQAHQLSRIEWTIPEEDASTYHRWPSSSIDFAPVKIGEDIFWLPTTVEGHFVKGKAHGDWVSHYSDYHRFAATSTLVPMTP